MTSLAALLTACGPQASKQTTANASGAATKSIEEREAAVPENPDKDAYFGELHLHTSYSLDAFIGGNRNTPEEAYRFARGEPMMINGQSHKLKRPLDFAAVTDHAEFIGEMYSTQVSGAPGHDNPMLVELRGLTREDEQRQWFLKYVVANNRSATPQHPPFYAGPETTRSAWLLNRTTTNRYYEPGRFTTLIGFEWTAAPNGGNMHRNVIFRDNNIPAAPFSNVDSADEEKLWDWIAAQRARGMKLFAIPHNSNGSKGQMFEAVDNSGKPIDAAYALRRATMEPLIEIMQIKANSEVTKQLWPNDEFAGFENGDSMTQFSGRVKAKDNYVRYALEQGTKYQRDLGANPFKYGIVGGTDNHDSAMGDTEEQGYIGSHGPADGSIAARRTGTIDGWISSNDSNPGALTGVWATKNTRAAIWDALAARESFGTSGTRMKIRMFGGDRLGAPATAAAMVKTGYKDGVPMGGTLKALTKAPTFTVWASKDPNGANLDRIQIIKGWTNAQGDPQERIIDVVWAGARKPGPDGKLPPVGNTVNVKTAKYNNSIGTPTLMGAWTDPDWNAAQNAVYYARALEIPTPRWTTYDAVEHNLPLLPDVATTIQERAWGSPIWYMPD